MYDSSFRFFLVVLGLYLGSCNAKVTEKQYASMPDLFYMDNWDKCMLLEDEAFFCSFTYTIESLNENNLSETYNIIKEVSSNSLNFNHTNLRHFVCMPWQCPEIPVMEETDPNLPKAIKQCYDKKFVHLGLKGEISSIRCDIRGSQKTRYPIGTLEILVAIIFVSYIVFVLIATFIEGLYRYKTEVEYNAFMKSSYGTLLEPFSLTRNWIRLKTVNLTPDMEKLKAMQGIRVYNLFIVIFSHTVLKFIVAPVSDTRYVETSNDKVTNMFLSSGPLCVSTFFQMSGFLLTLGMFDYFKEKKVIPFRFLWLAFLNRCIRLTPPMMVLLILHATWIPHLTYGPMWDSIIGREYRNCRENWWTNLLYIQNYVNKTEMCMNHTWYLCLDMQFFIAALILIYFMKRDEKKIPMILGICLVIHVIVTFLINYFNGYTATVLPEPELYYLFQLRKLEQWHSQLLAFHGNIPGVIVGMAYGYAFHRYKHTNLFTTKWRVAVWWIIILVLPLGVIILPGILIYNPSTPKNIFWASFYVASSRIIFTVGIGMIIFGLSQGIGWITKRVSEWPPIYILGRVTYSTYLVHATMLILQPAMLRSPAYTNDLLMFYNLLGDISISFLMGTILTLLVEMPTTALQKMLIPQKRTVIQQKTKNSE